MSSIHPINDDDMRIRSQPACQLSVANVDCKHPRGTALQQAIREPSRTSAEVCRDETEYINTKGVQCMVELIAATAYESWRRFEREFIGAAYAGSSPCDRCPIDEYVGGHDQCLSPRSVLDESALDQRFVQARPLACIT